MIVSTNTKVVWIYATRVYWSALHHLWCAVRASHQHESCGSLLHVFTRSFIKRQAHEPDIENACVTGTFDQPLWLKAAEILA